MAIRVDRQALARYGLNVTDVEEAVSAGGSGDVISTVIDGQKRYPVALHLPEHTLCDLALALGLRLPFEGRGAAANAEYQTGSPNSLVVDPPGGSATAACSTIVPTFAPLIDAATITR